MKIGVIGGGAAGFFSAITCADTNPHAKVSIFEKSNKLLSKVKVSGGGRCNVTNATFHNSELIKSYPRGGRFLKKCFNQFSSSDTVNWFEERGVQLKTEPDNRMFPKSNSSQTIIDCFLQQAKSKNICIEKDSAILKIVRKENGFELHTSKERIFVDRVIIASGGSPKREGLKWLEELGHDIVAPVPSLFTFKIPNDPITSLMGVSLEKAIIKIQGTKLQEKGPLLITHWGLSGPAILKLSAWGARTLHDFNYNFKISVNWTVLETEEKVREMVLYYASDKKKLSNTKIGELPSRVWDYILGKVSLIDKRWVDLSKKDYNRLINTLYNDTYSVDGKTTFKEEFVTCGGVDLSTVQSQNLMSKIHTGLYFCGEILDIDGITGGFNFQAAWTTGYIAGKNAALNFDS